MKTIKKELMNIGLDSSILNKLNDIDITNTNDLCKVSRKTLKKEGFSSSEINHIIIKLQLSGYDLSKK